MNAELEWVAIAVVLAAHEAQLARYGGSSGIRDVTLLESALARPRNVFHYEDQPALVRLAAVYAHGIVRNHPFLDGNKRTAFITSAVFLLSNGHHLRAPQAEVVTAMLQLASNAWDETAFAAWLHGHVAPLK